MKTMVITFMELRLPKVSRKTVVIWIGLALGHIRASAVEARAAWTAPLACGAFALRLGPVYRSSVQHQKRHSRLGLGWN